MKNIVFFFKKKCVYSHFNFLLLLLIISPNFLFSATYTMGTSGSQSATVTATSGSPDKFYDNGGSGSNYSSSVNATYTFNCAAGKYIRLKVNSLVTESLDDKFYVYDGAATTDRLTGEDYFTGTAASGYMYVATSGSLTVKFTSDASLNYAGWNIDVWIDDYPGQRWLGTTSTEITTASNWESGVLPYDGFTSIYIPSGTTYSPLQSNASSPFYFYDIRILSGATVTYSTSIDGHSLYCYGNFVCDGTFTKTGSYLIQCEGGNSSAYATISGSGTTTTASFDIGLNRLAYYKLLNNMTVYNVQLENAMGNSIFDMNNYNLTVYLFGINSSTTFYQRTGTLMIESNTPSIDDASFVEATGLTYFSRGTTWSAGNQTIPSITYYDLKIRTNNGYTSTVGTGSTITVSNDLTIINPSTSGGVATTANTITVANNFYLGNTGNALTLNVPYQIYRASGTGTFTMGNNTSHAINNTYASASNYVFSGFGSTMTFYGTFTYNSASAQKVIPGSYYNLTTSAAGTKTLYGNIDVDNDITLGGGTLAQGTYTINCGRNWTSTGDYYTEGSGLVTFDGTSSGTISGTSATYGASSGNTIYTDACESSTGWTLNGGTASWVNTTPTGTNSPANDNSASGTKCFKTEAAGTVYQNTKTYILTSPTISLSGYTNCSLSFYMWLDAEGTTSLWDGGFIEVYNGTTWVSATGSSAYDGTISSSFSNPYGGTSAWCYDKSSWTLVTVNISAYSGNSTFQIRFKFGSDSSTGAGGWAIDDLTVTGDVAGTAYSGEAFNYVTINKTGGAGITMGSKALIQNSATLTSGIITSTSSFYPEFDEDATVSSASNSSHVNGYVAKRTNTTTKFVFPVGNGTSYRQCSITPSNTNSTTWLAKYNSSAYTDLSLLDVASISNVEYWNIDRSGTTPANATIELSWDATSNLGVNYSNSTVAHYNGADWEDAGVNNLTGNSTSGVLESSANWSSYSPFAIATAGVPLPTEMVLFNAKKQDDNVLVYWQTANEIEMDYYEVEASFDGIHFHPLTSVQSKGNSSKNYYQVVDRDYVNGINYYRLKQVNLNGEEKYTHIASVNMSNSFEIVKTVNSLGQEVDAHTKGIVFDVYSDGSSVKRIQ